MIENPTVVIVAIIAAIPATWVGWLGHKRGRKGDLVIEHAGIATNQTQSIGQVIEGYEKLVDDQQEQIGYWRNEAKECRERELAAMNK